MNIMKMRFKKLFLSLTFLLIYIRGRSISFPEVYLFPVKMNYSFSLLSEKKNRIDFLEIIQLPEDIESGVWVLWKVIFFSGSEKQEYILTFWVSYEGETLLYSLKDGFYERGFDNIPLVISAKIDFNNLIEIGKNITLTYLTEYKSFTHPKTKIKLKSAIKARLTIGDINYFLYFVTKSGLYIIETPEEIFVRKDI